MTCPVTHAASSEHSQATSGATSAGVPTRPAGNFGGHLGAQLVVIQPVSFGPGPTALTVMPRWATSAESCRVNASSAPLEAV